MCTPTLKSASKKHQKLSTHVSEHRVWHSEGGKRIVYMCVLSPSGKNILQSLVRNIKARASNQRVSHKFAKCSPPFFRHSQRYLNCPQHLKRLKAPLISNVTHSLKRLITKRSAFKTLKRLGAIIVPECSKGKLY